jgi:hypothetical protein
MALRPPVRRRKPQRFISPVKCFQVFGGSQQLIGVNRSVHVNFNTRQVAMIEPRHLVVLSAGTREAISVITSTGIVPTTEYDAFLGESLKLGRGPFGCFCIHHSHHVGRQRMTELLHESESLKQWLVFFTAHDLHVRAISHNMFSLG